LAVLHNRMAYVVLVSVSIFAFITCTHGRFIQLIFTVNFAVFNFEFAYCVMLVITFMTNELVLCTC
jgi:hypothetical protein